MEKKESRQEIDKETKGKGGRGREGGGAGGRGRRPAGSRPSTQDRALHLSNGHGTV